MDHCINCGMNAESHIGGYCLPAVVAGYGPAVSMLGAENIDAIMGDLDYADLAHYIPRGPVDVRQALTHVAQDYGAILSAIGDDPPEEGGMLWNTLSSTRDLLWDTASAPGRFVRSQIEESMQSMDRTARSWGQLAKDAAANGNESLAELFAKQSESMENLLKSMGRGAGEGWREFWGLPPWVFWGVGVVALVATVATAGYLLLTPGGQGVLVGGGKLAAGGGTALARLAI